MIPKVTDDHKNTLQDPFTTEEVKTALFSMHPDKSLGIDGMNLAFFPIIIQEDLVKFYLMVIDTKMMPVELHKMVVVLIPKKKNQKLWAI